MVLRFVVEHTIRLFRKVVIGVPGVLVRMIRWVPGISEQGSVVIRFILMNIKLRLVHQFPNMRWHYQKI